MMILRIRFKIPVNVKTLPHHLKSSFRVIFIILAIVFLDSCFTGDKDHSATTNPGLIGDLVIFHAGSLSVPLKQISQQFERDNPGVRVLLEAAGSVDCARKITELKKPCDLMASSDYKVIEKFLVPEFTRWHIPFASNEMVIGFKKESREADSINSANWPDILLKPEVRYARSDPDSDPCGYRTIMVFELAESYFGRYNLARELAGKDLRYVRPKEVDLLALLEVGEIDYIFTYRSVAIQHGLEFLELPDEINLKNPEFANHYQSVLVKIPGNNPGDSVIIHGDPMVYSITMLDNAPNPSVAIAFLDFLMSRDKGMKVMEELGQKSVIPAKSRFYQYVPEDLKKYLVNQ